jgi:hypothetical protein
LSFRFDFFKNWEKNWEKNTVRGRWWLFTRTGLIVGGLAILILIILGLAILCIPGGFIVGLFYALITSIREKFRLKRVESVILEVKGKKVKHVCLTGDDDLENFTGKGRYTWSSGNVYEGDITKGKLTGTGKKIYKDGRVYEGSFVDEKAEGMGKMTHPDGSVLEGLYVDGKFVFKK